MMTYQQQIKDPRWQKKRLQVLNLHKFKCQSCGSKSEELHVHHPFYKRGAMIWEYDKKELECLCHKCHKDAHEIDEKIKRALALCRDKPKVLDFILSLTTTNEPPRVKARRSMITPPVIPVVTAEKSAAQLEIESQEEEQRDEERRRLWDIEFYAKNPHLRPSRDDDEHTRSQKFFAKMRAMLG